MPYRYAHWWVFALIALSGLAFWSGYLSQLDEAPFEFHLHGVTAFLWMVLLAAQSWTIHEKRRDLHRAIGFSSFGLFPFFLASSLLIAVGMAKRYVDETSPFHVEYAARLAPLDVVSVIGMSYFFFMALKWRKNVYLHARYMLATLVFLINPVIGRLLTDIPPFKIEGDDQLYIFADAVRTGNVSVLVLLAMLYRSSGKNGRPFLEASVFVVIQMLLFETLGRSSAWEQIYSNLAFANPVLVALPGIAIGVLVIVSGWIAGGRAQVQPDRGFRLT